MSLSSWMQAAGVEPEVDAAAAERIAPRLEDVFFAFFRSGIPLEEWNRLSGIERDAAVVARRRRDAELFSMLANALADPQGAAERFAAISVGDRGRAEAVQEGAENAAVSDVMGQSPAGCGGPVEPPEGAP